MADLPDGFFEWQFTQRRKNLEAVLNHTRVAVFDMLALHDPIVATLDEQSLRVNMASKGVGLVLADSAKMQTFVDEANRLIEKTYMTSEKDTFDERINLLLGSIYVPFDANGDWKTHVDRAALGTLEMYGGTTYANILANGKASLMYSTLKAGGYFSQQFHADVVVHGPESLFYQYFVALHDIYHIPPQKKADRTERFPCAYEFRITEVWDKAPGPNAGTRLA